MPQKYDLQEYDNLTPQYDLQRYDAPSGFASGYSIPSLRDIGTTALKMPVQLGETLVGLGDIPTGGYFSKGLEYLGYDPKMTKNFISSFESDELKAARKQFAESDGLSGVASSVWQNPGLAALTLEESLPYMAGGAGVARGAMRFAPKLAPRVAGAIGEGILGAGSQAAQIREDKGDFDTSDALYAAGSGALTGLISGGSGKVASKLGLPDIDAMLADDAVRGVRRIPALLGGGASEAIEESLQSGQEQAAVNLATDKPVGQGVAPSMMMGGLTGGIMGASVPAFRRTPPVVPSLDRQFDVTPDTRLPSGGGPISMEGIESLPSSLSSDFTAPPKPRISAEDFIAMRNARSAEQQAPSTPAPVTAPETRPQVVTISSPDAATVESYRNQGYVSVPGLRSPEGYPQMVRGDIAPLYVTGDKRAPAPQTRSQIQPSAVPGAIPEGNTVAGDTISTPNELITNEYIANMKESGYKLEQKGPTQSIFKRFFTEDEGTFDPQQMWTNLKQLLGRDPTPEEVEQGMRRQVQSGEATGRVAEFPSNATNLYELTQEIQQGTGNADALMQRAQQIIDGYKTASQARTDYVEVNRLANRAQDPNQAELFQSIADSIKEKGNELNTAEYAGFGQIRRMDEMNFVSDAEQAQGYPPGLMEDDNTDRGIVSFPNKGMPGSEGIEYLSDIPPGPNDYTVPSDIAGIRQQETLGPRAVGPEDIAATITSGQSELPWSRGEADQPVDADFIARMRQNAADRLTQPMQTQPQQTSLEGQMKDAEIADYLRREDALPPEMKDLSEYGPDLMDPNRDEPSFARVKGGGLTASVDIRRAVENITRDYTSPLPGIMNREGMQNALDAADKLGLDGVVKVRLDDNNHSIEIYDNGSGLDETGLATKLVEIFATGKEGEEGATGGKGIGSASYIYGGQHFKVESIAVDRDDGIKYKITASGTPEQFLDPVKGSDFEKVPVSDDTPTGTLIEVILKSEQNLEDARAMLKNVTSNSRNRHSRVITDEFGVTAGIPLSKIESGGGATEHTFANSKDDKMIGDFTTSNRNSDVKVLIPPNQPNTPRDRIEIHYLNNGMYQFTKIMNLGGTADGAPGKILVDLHPLVDDLNDLYPFINTREDIKDDIREEVVRYITENIAGPAVERRKNRVQELYDSMSNVPIQGARRKSVIYDPGNRLTADEMKWLEQNPTIQNLVRVYDSLIDDIVHATGRTKWRDRLEGVGLVFDPGMHGVHIPNPATNKSTILINPFIRIGDASFTPKEAAWRNVGTNLHEVAHIGSEQGSEIKWSDKDKTDPRLGEYVTSYMNELQKHGDVRYRNTGHGMSFAQRLGEVYARFGIDATFKAADEIHKIYTGAKPDRLHPRTSNQPGGYSPEIQKLLQLYTESRGRAATTEDLLSGTGIKQSDRESTGEGTIPSNSSTDGDGIVAKVKALGSRFVKEDAGTFSPVDLWRNTKAATGWGQGGTTRAQSKAAAETNWVKEALAVPTNATTMLDLSAPGRQGLSLILTPEFWRASAKMFQGLSYDSYKQIDADLRAKPIMQTTINAKGKTVPSFASQIGTKIFSPASERVGPRAEATASRWLEMGIGKTTVDPATGKKTWSPTVGSKLWQHTVGYPIRATNRAFITFLNHLNINRTEKLLNLGRDMSIEALTTGKARQGMMPWKQSFTPTEAQNLNPYHNLVLAKDIADFVNTATGHGPLKTHILPFKQTEVSLEAAAGKLGYVLFSPGLLASRVRMMNPSTYIMATPFVRKQYAKAAISTAAAWFVMSQLIKYAAGEEAEVSNDITSADFGKVRIGDTRLDLGGGFLQFAVAYGRMYEGGSTSSASGEFHRFGSGYQAQTQEDMMERFFVNKLNPVAKFAWDVYSASEYNPFHVGDRTAQLFIPLLMQDLMEIGQEDPSLIPITGTTAMFGGGTQVYSKGESVSKFMNPEQDWNVTGGGIRDLMPWNWNNEEGDPTRSFPWSEPTY